jgi:hypothetical protein
MLPQRAGSQRSNIAALHTRGCHELGGCPVFLDVSQFLESSTGISEPVVVIKNYLVPADEAERGSRANRRLGRRPRRLSP